MSYGYGYEPNLQMTKVNLLPIPKSNFNPLQIFFKSKFNHVLLLLFPKKESSKFFCAKTKNQLESHTPTMTYGRIFYCGFSYDLQNITYERKSTNTHHRVITTIYPYHQNNIYTIHVKQKARPLMHDYDHPTNEVRNVTIL